MCVAQFLHYTMFIRVSDGRNDQLASLMLRLRYLYKNEELTTDIITNFQLTLTNNYRFKLIQTMLDWSSIVYAIILWSMLNRQVSFAQYKQYPFNHGMDLVWICGHHNIPSNHSSNLVNFTPVTFPFSPLPNTHLKSNHLAMEWQIESEGMFGGSVQLLVQIIFISLEYF